MLVNVFWMVDGTRILLNLDDVFPYRDGVRDNGQPYLVVKMSAEWIGVPMKKGGGRPLRVKLSYNAFGGTPFKDSARVKFGEKYPEALQKIDAWVLKKYPKLVKFGLSSPFEPERKWEI